MRYDSLIFDIDGTLWDSRALVARGYNQQLQKEGLERYQVDAEQLKSLFGKPIPEIGDALFPDLTPEERHGLIARCTAAQDDFLKDASPDIAYPQVTETIKALSQHYRLFIVSNSCKGYPELCIHRLGLTPYIEGHLCFGDTGTSKGQTILTLMKKFGLKDPVYIGDTQGDYEATQEAGIPFIFAAYGFGSPVGYAEKIRQISDLIQL